MRDKIKRKITWRAVMKRANTEGQNEGKHWFLGGKRKEKKEKNVSGASEVRRLHTPYMEEKKVETNRMTQWNNVFYHWSQPHTPF
jgi:hypothetical protein